MISNQESITYLVFKRHFHIKFLDGEKIALISEDTQYLLSGSLYVEIAKQISTSNLTENDLKEKLIHKFPHAEIIHGISRLKQKGFLTYSNNNLPLNQEAFWHEQNISIDS